MTGALLQGMTQASRQSKRLYVGNIPQTISEPQLKEFFSAAMISAGLVTPGLPGPSVTESQISYDRGFAFIELRTPEEATRGLTLDGITLQGQSLKVRRPKDYTGPDPAAPGAAFVPGIISTQVPDTPNKIFIGGLPSNLEEEQVKELVSAFGPLKAFNLVKDTTTNLSKGYAFFEFADPDVTDKACEGLNGFKLGDKTLVVQRAHLGAKNSVDIATGSVTGTGVIGTRILKLSNLVAEDELKDDEEVQDIEMDVKEECERVGGQVKSLVIPRPGPAGERVPGIGHIFVEFLTVEDAAKALRDLNGRKFGENVVEASFYNEQLYISKEF